jgi:hypothetical protein
MFSFTTLTPNPQGRGRQVCVRLKADSLKKRLSSFKQISGFRLAAASGGLAGMTTYDEDCGTTPSHPCMFNV